MWEDMTIGSFFALSRILFAKVVINDIGVGYCVMIRFSDVPYFIICNDSVELAYINGVTSFSEVVHLRWIPE